MARNSEAQWRDSAVTNKQSAPIIFRDTLYDKQSYAAVGQSGAMGFFAVPLHQGQSLYSPAGGAKTYSDTNMDLAGQLSTGEAFRAEFMAFNFQSGLSAAVQSAAAAAPAVVALAAQDEETFWFSSGAFFELKLLSKVLARGLVHKACPPVRKSLNMAATVAFALAAAADETTQITGTVLVPVGHLWEFTDPGLRLDANSKFSLTLNWNKAFALPSGLPGIITAELVGERMEVSQ